MASGANMSKLSAAFRPSAPNDRTFNSVCKANEHFTKKEYKLAIGNFFFLVKRKRICHLNAYYYYNYYYLDEYTKALTLAQPSLERKNATAFTALIFSNRSASYYKCKKWVEALKDADQVIRLMPEWPKVKKKYDN
jgi:tetratricopeptide (TPR) repeat protein